MKTISWTVSAVRTNGNKDKVELGESPRGGAMFEDGELIGFIGYDGIEFIDANDVFSVFEGDEEYLKEDFICGDFGLDNSYMEKIIDDE